MTDDVEIRIAATERLLLASCDDLGLDLTGDQRVNEADAARLLGFDNSCSLKNARHEGRAPHSYRHGRSITYRILDLAEWIERGRESW